MQRALITGLSGFTGRYLAEVLQNHGWEIFGTGHGHTTTNHHIFSIDLCMREEVQRMVDEVQPELVAHLAAVSFIGHGDIEAIYRVNILGTRNLLEALANLAQPPRKVLLASSANIYGNAPVEIIDETVLPAPVNDYAVSKLAMEYMAFLWMQRLPIVITRPFNYTGVGQDERFLLPKIVAHFQRGERTIELGNLDIERDFSDVRTVAAAYAALLQLSPASTIFNVCSGRSFSLRAVLAMMAEIAGYAIEVHVNPVFVRANEVKRLQGNRARLRGVIGSLEDIPLTETLRWMYMSPSS